MPYPNFDPQAYVPGPEDAYDQPDSPLSAYAPGNKLTPQQRARMLKKTKKGAPQQANPALTALQQPPSVLSGT